MDKTFPQGAFLLKKLLQSFLNEQFKKYGLTSSELLFLHMLYFKEESTQVEIARLMECDKSHAHRIENRLLEKNLIEFTSSSRFKLTETGRNISEKVNSAMENWNARLKSGISQDDINTTKCVLCKILANAQDILGEHNV